MTAYAQPEVTAHRGRVPGQSRPHRPVHPQDGSFHLESTGTAIHTNRVIIDGRVAGLLVAFIDQMPRVWVALRWDGELAQAPNLESAVEFLGRNVNPQALLPGVLYPNGR